MSVQNISKWFSSPIVTKEPQGHIGPLRNVYEEGAVQYVLLKDALFIMEIIYCKKWEVSKRMCQIEKRNKL